MRVAVIHYWFITRRGGEKVVESILKLYPNADVYTLFYDRDIYGNYLDNNKVYTSSLNTKFLRKHYQKIFPLYPLGIKSLKLKGNYDLVISSESGPAKGISIKNGAKHICYIHSPMRYCWGYTNEYLQSMNPIIRPIANYFFKRLKKWDQKTINNVDLYVANSINVSKRVKNFYNKKAMVIYPPIDPKLFDKELVLEKEKKYFLSFGAITPYKRIDLLVDCFNKNGENLIIIGNGSEKEKLEKRANSNIVFKGFVSDAEIERYIKKARALLFPGEEDFGMIPLEVMAKGIPVIAFKKGGVLETVVENRNDILKSTGLFFEVQNVESIQNTLDYFSEVEHKFDANWIRNHAKSFEESKFLHSFKMVIKKFLKHKKT